MIVATRMTFSLSRSSSSIFVIANALLFLGFYTLNAYPLRTGLKWFWIAIFVVLTVRAVDTILVGMVAPQRTRARAMTASMRTPSAELRSPPLPETSN